MINSPDDLKKLSSEEVRLLASEIRDRIIEVSLKNGGHLASNLGTVELTLALHRVLKTPYDRIIFDVGHQCYTHKLITGRSEMFDTIRKPGGLSGFTKRGESVFDCFGCGHSSTSLSAALGFAEADKLAGRQNYTVAVIGDGAFTGGMIHEALNNCRKDLRLIIILNENEMSISKNIGLFAKHIAKIRASKGYYRTKRQTISFLNRIPVAGPLLFSAIRNIKQTIKNIMYGSNYFEGLGLYYLGPIDGNDCEKVELLLSEAVKSGGSAVIHIKTKKGKGYPPAEESPERYHSVKPEGGNTESESFSRMMGTILTEMADEKKDICAITAAMCGGTGLEAFSKAHPERFFDVGIAEDHALTFCAGLAASGLRPFFAVYSSFLQRGYDSIIHDIVLQKLPVVILVDRAGLSPSDGPTHHGIYDVGFLSQTGEIEIYAPVSRETLRLSLEESYESGKICAVRYPAGCENAEIVSHFYKQNPETLTGAVADFEEGERKDKLIITYGTAASGAIGAEKILGKNTGVILLEKINFTDELVEKILKYICEGCDIVFYEEGNYFGGAGMALGDELSKRGALKKNTYRIIALNPPGDSDVSYIGNGSEIKM